MTQYDFSGDDPAEVIHKATTGRANGPDVAKCWNLVRQIRTLKCRQKDIREREIPDLNRQISSLRAHIRQLEADKPRLDPSPPQIGRGRSRLGAAVSAIADAIAAVIQAANQAKRRRIDAQIESIKGEIEGLKSKIVHLDYKWNDINDAIERHFALRRSLGCPHVDMAFFVC